MRNLGTRNQELGISGSLQDARVARLFPSSYFLVPGTSCGSPVVYLGKRVCINTGGLPQPVVTGLLGVNKSMVFCSACAEVLQGLIHSLNVVFSSVIGKVLHIVHRPYNNKEFFKSFILLFIRRTK